MEVTELDGRAYAKFVAAGSYFLGKYRTVLNDLNVFPVPDGDTGTNMYLTCRQAALSAGRVQDRSLARVAAAAAQGALMGARGNSGVIISQMLRGFAHHVRHRSEIDTFVLATGMREGVAAAKQSLVRVIEGTILSVAEAAAEHAYHLALHERDFYRFLSGVLRSANEALEKTPEQLPALKEAGVVDAGGAGFVYFLEGILQFLPAIKVRATAFPRRPERRQIFTAQQRVGAYKYCTEFMLERASCTAAQLREHLKTRGDSLIVAGEEPLKVHLHTDDPQAVQTFSGKWGLVSRIKVDDMERQHNVLLVDRPAIAYSTVCVVPGSGFARIARELGAEVVLEISRNPSVRELLLGVNRALSERVYLFVNDRNAVPAAQEAAELSERAVHVLATDDVLAGIAGLFALRAADSQASPDPQAIISAAHQVRTAQTVLCREGRNRGWNDGAAWETRGHGWEGALWRRDLGRRCGRCADGNGGRRRRPDHGVLWRCAEGTRRAKSRPALACVIRACGRRILFRRSKARRILDFTR